MTTHRNDGLPELPEKKIIGTSRYGTLFYGHDDSAMRAYGEACRRASPSVGGVRVPDAEIQAAYEAWCKPRMSNIEPDHSRDAYEAGYMAASARLNAAAEVGEVEKIADQFADKTVDARGRTSWDFDEHGLREFGRRLAGSGKES